MKLIPFRPVTFVLALALGACATRTSYVDLYGQSAAPLAAERTIAIMADTQYVNVEGGEIIRFIVGDKEFAWNFNVAQAVRQFRLNDIAPPGMLNHAVRAYVSPDPKYMGGGDQTP